MSKSDQLKAAIARIPQTADYARRIAGERNSPEAQAILALADLAAELFSLHTPEFQLEIVADDFDGLATKARSIAFDADADLAPDSYEGMLFNARGNLIGLADQVVQCAAALGSAPRQPSRPMPGKAEIARDAHRHRLDALLGHVRKAREELDESIEPELKADDLEPLQREILGGYVREMHVTENSIRVTISFGELIDLVALERWVTRLADVTGEMAASVRHWSGRAADRIRAGIKAVSQPVKRAAGSIGGLILTILRGESRTGAGDEAETPPIPDDFLDEAKAMILAGQAPPAHWTPRIATLNFDGEELADLTPIAGLAALKGLSLNHTQVADLAPIAGLENLTVHVESRERAAALRASLPKGSKLDVIAR